MPKIFCCKSSTEACSADHLVRPLPLFSLRLLLLPHLPDCPTARHWVLVLGTSRFVTFDTTSVTTITTAISHQQGLLSTYLTSLGSFDRVDSWPDHTIAARGIDLARFIQGLLPDGVIITVDASTSDGLLSLRVSLPDTLLGHAQGLLSLFDDDLSPLWRGPRVPLPPSKGLWSQLDGSPPPLLHSF